MKTYLVSILFILAFFYPFNCTFSKSNTNNWEAKWIAIEDDCSASYKVQYFRKEVKVPSKPNEFVVYVSGDSRYKLYVNGILVSCGPARGDKEHWNYETVDLAPHMKSGNNILAAVVWDEGKYRPIANMSYKTAFFMQGVSKEARIANTNKSWICISDRSYSPLPVSIPNYYVAGPGEFVDMHTHIKDWKDEKCDCSNWTSAKVISNAFDQSYIGPSVLDSWVFQEPLIPSRSLEKLRINSVRKVSKGISVTDNFLKGSSPVVIPSNSHFRLILDQKYLTNSYFTLKFSGGNNSYISINYQESLFSSYPFKGNRNDIDGKILIGRKDSIISNGDKNQEFTTLSWRTYRYVEINVTTESEKLIIDDIYGTATGYPFKLNASLRTENEDIKNIFSIGWRTASLCAVDTYMDCPYYEQLQYLGDSRIQALVTLYNSGDNRLVKNFLSQSFLSIKPEGIVQSRYPSSENQIITPYALSYIGALHDFMMYSNDTAFVKQQLAGTRIILEYFYKYQNKEGLLYHLPWWNFTDWSSGKGWNNGVAPIGEDGYSSVLDLQLLLAYEYAESLEENFGMKSYAELYGQRITLMKKSINDKYWSSEKLLYSDRSEKDLFSQHANSLAILTKVSQGKQSSLIAEKLMNDSSLVQATIYFKFYLHAALTKAGFGDKYMSWLDIWRDNLKMGLTTWAETSEIDQSRSDCHAWGSSPNIEFFRTILGIDSNSPCFKSVSIEPHLGNIMKIGGTMPHPNGSISVDYKRIKGKLIADITLPRSISGIFRWQGKDYIINEGDNKFELDDSIFNIYSQYSYADIIDIHSIPEIYKPLTGRKSHVDCFSDCGSWMGFSLPVSSDITKGFCGPFSIAKRYWFAKSLVSVDVEGSNKLQKGCYYPGLLEIENNDVTQKLIFSSSDKVIIDIYNPKKLYLKLRSIGINPNVSVALYDDGIALSHSSGEGVRLVFSDNVRVTKGDYGYEITSNESHIAAMIKWMNYEKKDVDDKASINLELSNNALSENRRRWSDYLIKTLRTDMPSAYNRIAVKSVVTLLSNWRVSREGLHHQAIVPSSSSDYFVGWWSWDCWKFSVALSKINPELAKDNMRAIFDYQQPNGMIIDCIHLDTIQNNKRDTKPPLCSWAVNEIFQNNKDTLFLKEMFPKLCKYYNWWYKDRDHNKNGICEFGSCDGTLQAAMWESGMDDAIRFDDSKIVRNSDNAWSLDQESVDLNCYLDLEKRYLIKFSKILNTKFISAKPQKDINKYFFNKKRCFFTDRKIHDNKFIDNIGCEGYIPLWTMVATKKQFSKILPILKDTDKFSSFIPFPTIAVDDPKLDITGYWRGSIWLDQTYFAIGGIRKYGQNRLADKYTDKVFTCLEGIQADAPIYENYDTFTGKGIRSQSHNFSWSAAHLLMLYNEYGN